MQQLAKIKMPRFAQNCINGAMKSGKGEVQYRLFGDAELHHR